jgi:hypothetical protein
MLSLSADLFEATVDLQLINGDENAAEGDLPHAKALMHFAEAFALRDEQALQDARNTLLEEAGEEMVRIADSTGIPLDERNVALSAGVRKELNLGRFGSASNTPDASLKTRLLSLIARPLVKRMIKNKKL